MFVSVLHGFSYCEEALPNITDTNRLLGFQQPPGKLSAANSSGVTGQKDIPLTPPVPETAGKQEPVGQERHPALLRQCSPGPGDGTSQRLHRAGPRGPCPWGRGKGAVRIPLPPPGTCEPPGSPPVPAAPQRRYLTQHLRPASLSRYLRPPAPLSRSPAVTARRPYGPRSEPPDPGDAILSGPRRRDGVTP